MQQFAASFCVVFLSAISLVTSQQAQLRIVVLEGENAVNIIQQKTAVRALVEVRDRNNVPVPGASVTFTVTGKGGATVGGAQTITATTNTAGQAALSAGSPASAGSLQIGVNATFNGVTASATITQTVVATAAAAAAATAAAAGTATSTAGTGAAAAGAGAGAAAGGGIGTGAIIGIVGGAVAVGGGLAASSAGGQRDERDVRTGALPLCVNTASPTTITVPFEGGTYVVNVTQTPTECNPREWTVANIPSFVSVDRTTGTGNGSVTLTVSRFVPQENFPARDGVISVAGNLVRINQPRAVSGLNP